MFSRVKLTTPASSTSASSTIMKKRCLSAKATIAFMRSLWRSSAAGGAIDEQRAARDHAIAGSQSLHHFIVAVAGATERHLPDRSVVSALHDPDARERTLEDHRLLRHPRRDAVGAGGDRKGCKHLGLEQMLGVVEHGMHGDTTTGGIHGVRDKAEPCVKLMLGQCQHMHGDALPHVHAARGRFAHVRHQPYGGKVG